MEMAKFVLANTQELAKDKWLCPLSGKKFRGPEFVKKHIFNKHADKVEGVKTEVLYEGILFPVSGKHHVLISHIITKYFIKELRSLNIEVKR